MRQLGIGLLVVGFLSLLPTSAEGQVCAPNCWVLTGRIVGPQLEPLAGVDLDLNVSGTATSVLLSGDVTAADGTFTITLQETAPQDFYDLIVNPPTGSSYFPGVVTGTFLVGPTFAYGDIMVDRGSRLTGRVVTELGTGLTDVDLNFFDPITGLESLFSSDVTVSDGTFSVLVTPAVYDVEFRVTLTTPGGPFVPVFLDEQPLTADLALGDIVFFDGHLLTGTVRDAQGLAVSGADIDVRDPLTGDALVTPSDNTDVNGNFSVLVPTGNWNVEVDPPLGSILVAKFVDVTITGGVTNSIGVVTLPNGVNLSGTTVDGNGVAVSEVDLDFVISSTQIEIPTAHDNADLSGQFSVQVEPDIYDIQFRPQFASGLAPVVLPMESILVDRVLPPVVLPQGPALTGTVTDNGVPIAGVEVTLSDPSTGSKVYTFGNETNALGMYGLRQLAGTYDVLFTPPLGSGLAPGEELGVSFLADTVLDFDFSNVGTAPASVTSLACVASGSDGSLSWVNGELDYDSVQILRDGITIASLTGSATSHLDTGLPVATYQYSVIPVRAGLSAIPVDCSITIAPPPTDQFIRGDTNISGQVNIADVIFLLDVLFSGADPGLACPDALDANDSGERNIADAIFLLGYLFAGEATPPAPFPNAGADPTFDTLAPCP